jgi:hypothetical protein
MEPGDSKEEVVRGVQPPVELLPPDLKKLRHV